MFGWPQRPVFPNREMRARHSNLLGHRLPLAGMRQKKACHVEITQFLPSWTSAPAVEQSRAEKRQSMDKQGKHGQPLKQEA